ncbi:2-acylglycerol O-acyltransferase [Malassezia psittaci]|uniref:diacylglycerol O-acyltransferase n=1 Tax=Malassezia psittaci TaxID=1821823 RepID=A0AAF0FFS7_9BASI|nr:2-acylglycerol O-acyltransferase [Malassezia psittaci]
MASEERPADKQELERKLIANTTLPPFWLITVPYMTWFLVFDRAAVSGGRRSARLRNSVIYRLMREYFPVRLINKAPLPPDRPYLFGYHPHGIIGMGAVISFGTEACGFSEKFPGITPSLLTLASNFKIPLYRDYLLGLGFSSVSRNSCENILRKGPGSAIVIVVGGAQESLKSRPGVMNLTLEHRKGFVRVAMRTGADLVPTLGFGENELFNQANNQEGTWLYRLQQILKHSLGFTVPAIAGRGLLHDSFGLMPYQRPITIVTGEPVQVLHTENPTEEEVDEMHKRYIQALEKNLMADVRPLAYLTLIRHGESRANVERVLQGVTDAPLTARGEAQLEALEAAWRPMEDRSNEFNLPRPHLIVASPIRRAYRTGCAVARGCGFEIHELGNTTFRSPVTQVPLIQQHTSLLIDSGLSERNFGKAECTRKGRAVPGFAKPDPKDIGRADTHTSFQHRVVKEGKKWINWLMELAQSQQQQGAKQFSDPASSLQESEPNSREATPSPAEAPAYDALQSDPITSEAVESGALAETDLFTTNSASPNPNTESAPDIPPVRTFKSDPPHLVLVSHGQWIHTFLKSMIPELRNSFYVRSSNTGLYTLELHPSPNKFPRLSVLLQDDTRHLDLAPQSKKKCPQRTTLDGLWAAASRGGHKSA